MVCTYFQQKILPSLLVFHAIYMNQGERSLTYIKEVYFSENKLDGMKFNKGKKLQVA